MLLTLEEVDQVIDTTSSQPESLSLSRRALQQCSRAFASLFSRLVCIRKEDQILRRPRLEAMMLVEQCGWSYCSKARWRRDRQQRGV